MVTQDNDMMLIKVSTYLLKICLGWLGAMAVFQNVLTEEMFNILMNALPSQVAMFFGFLYLVAIVFRKLSDSWTHHQINRLKVKEERERHKQSKIYTEIKEDERNQKKKQ